MPLLSFVLAAAAQHPAAPPPRPPAPATVSTEKTWPVTEHDTAFDDFMFANGETLPRLTIHYRTLGKPHRGADGQIDNAVMVLHGTGGTGAQFLRPQFANELYGPGQPLDIAKYWIILPDNIGHGGSSKPSDGLRMAFPRYDYDDMVTAQYRLVTQTLGIRRMRLIMGTSMGCMHAFVWGETYPDFARALMPLACQPVAIAGLNRMWRQLLIDGITADPAWQGGDYDAQPVAGLRTATALLTVAGAAPMNYQTLYPTRDAAAAYARERMAAGIGGIDANDTIYQFDSSRNYDPWPALEAIAAPMTWVNSADDFINPRNFDFPARAVARMPDARFRMIPENGDTHGHGTHTWAKFWKADLVALLARSE